MFEYPPAGPSSIISQQNTVSRAWPWEIQSAFLKSNKIEPKGRFYLQKLKFLVLTGALGSRCHSVSHGCRTTKQF